MWDDREGSAQEGIDSQGMASWRGVAWGRGRWSQIARLHVKSYISLVHVWVSSRKIAKLYMKIIIVLRPFCGPFLSLHASARSQYSEVCYRSFLPWNSISCSFQFSSTHLKPLTLVLSRSAASSFALGFGSSRDNCPCRSRRNRGLESLCRWRRRRHFRLDRDGRHG